MTNEDLLQQAKDQVAEAHPDKYENWDALVAAHADSHSWVAVTELQDIAACLAIQSAREEARTSGNPKGQEFLDCHRCGEPAAGSAAVKSTSK